MPKKSTQARPPEYGGATGSQRFYPEKGGTIWVHGTPWIITDVRFNHDPFPAVPEGTTPEVTITAVANNAVRSAAEPRTLDGLVGREIDR